MLITVDNVECVVTGSSKAIDELLKANLRYTNSSAKYKYYQTVKQIKYINSLLDSSNLLIDAGELERKLTKLLRVNKSWERKMNVPLYVKGRFLTGLLPRVEYLLSEAGHQYTINDTRKKPTSTKQLLLRESFPPLRYYQKQANANFLESHRGIIVQATGCHAKGQEVLMYDGTMRKVEDVKVGDLLMGPDSARREVLNLYRGYQEMVEITPIKGNPFVVNLDHILSLKQTRRRKDDKKANTIVNISVREWLTKSATFKHLHKLYRVPVEFETNTELPIDPYFLGIWLGDGAARSITIYTPEPEIKQYCFYIADKFNLQVTVRPQRGCELLRLKKTNNKNTILDIFKSLDLIANKHIPHIYKTAPMKQRLELIAGMLDTDGHRTCNGFDWISISETLANDFVFVCRSVGLSAYKSKQYKKCQLGSGNWFYRVSISGDCSIIPNKVPRKKCSARSQKKSNLVTGFTVRLLAEDHYYGFELSGDHLYLLDDFTVTHNTGKSLLAAKIIWELSLPTLILTPSKALTDNMFDLMVKHFGKGKVERLKTKTAKLKEINIVNIQAAIKLDPKLFANIGLVIMDEFHHNSATTYLEFNKNHLKNVYHRLGLTATAYRNDGSDMGLEGVLSNVVFEYTARQGISDGYLVYPDIRFVKNTVPSDSTYQKEYKNSIVLNPNRNELIADLAKTHAKDHVIILVQQIEHGKLLNELIPNSRFICGAEKDSVRANMFEDFKLGKFNCLIGVDKILGEGVDLPIADVLVLANGGKAMSAVIQNVGRVLRPFPNKTKAIVYDFKDFGSNWLSKHSELREQYYKIYDSDEVIEDGEV